MHTHEQVLSALRLEDNGVPIYVQLREQFLRAMTVGFLQPGQQMPTMRQTAVALKVDLNTVRHAYEELERLGAVVLIRGRGSFVAERPAGPAGQDRDSIEELARQTLAAAAALGLKPQAVAERIAALAAQEEEIR
jgi:GntR family transcriptional regulator